MIETRQPLITEKGNTLSRLIDRVPLPVRRGLALAGAILAVPLGWFNLTRTTEIVTHLPEHVQTGLIYYDVAKQEAVDDVAGVRDDLVRGGTAVVGVADDLGFSRGQLAMSTGLTAAGGLYFGAKVVEAAGRRSAATIDAKATERANLRALIEGIKVEKTFLPGGNGQQLTVSSAVPVKNLRVRVAVFPDFDAERNRLGKRTDFVWHVGDLGPDGVTTTVSWSNDAVTRGSELVPLTFDEELVGLLRGKMPNRAEDGPRVEVTRLDFDRLGGGCVQVQHRDGAIKGKTHLNSLPFNSDQNLGIGRTL